MERNIDYYYCCKLLWPCLSVWVITYYVLTVNAVLRCNIVLCQSTITCPYTLYSVLLLGGFEYYVQARKHYALSLQNQSAQHNLRAVYGVLYASRAAAAEAANNAEGSADS